MPIDAPTLDKVLEGVAQGQPLHVALEQNGVSNGSFYRHMDADPAAAERYARARNVRNDRIAEDTLRVSDDLSIPPEHKRIMVDARKWLLSKLAPKKYGERTVIAGDADNPIAFADAKADLLRGLAPRAAGSGETPSSDGVER